MNRRLTFTVKYCKTSMSVDFGRITVVTDEGGELNRINEFFRSIIYLSLFLISIKNGAQLSELHVKYLLQVARISIHKRN